jgi:hypothetical protein
MDEKMVTKALLTHVRALGLARLGKASHSEGIHAIGLKIPSTPPMAGIHVESSRCSKKYLKYL